MAFDYKITIDGFRFRVLSIYGDSGVLVSNNVDLDDHDYVEALKKGQQALRAANLIEAMNVNMNLQSPATMEIDECRVIEDIYQELQRQHYFTLPSDLQGYVERVSSRKDELQLDLDTKFAKVNDKSGYVYLVKNDDGYYKIGMTKNWEDRRKTFNVLLPFEIEYTHLIHTKDMAWLEHDLHRRFDHKRVNGEWFKLDDADVEYIKAIK